MMQSKWKVTVFILFGLFAASFFISLIFDDTIKEGFGGNVAVIKVRGPIMIDEIGGFGGTTTATPATIINFIKQADENDNVEAIIFDINSPGGSPVATDEIAQAIKKTNKTTVALIREVGASGAYWIATSCDVIVSNRMSVVGSIGVIGSYLDFSGLIEDYNVSYERLVAGKYKDMGTPFRSLSEEERVMYQKTLDRIREFFIDEVAKNRGMPFDKVSELAEGQIFLGIEAKEQGLVDILGNYDTAIKYIEELHNITVESVVYTQEKSMFSELFTSSVKSYLPSSQQGVTIKV